MSSQLKGSVERALDRCRVAGLPDAADCWLLLSGGLSNGGACSSWGVELPEGRSGMAAGPDVAVAVAPPLLWLLSRRGACGVRSSATGLEPAECRCCFQLRL